MTWADLAPAEKRDAVREAYAAEPLASAREIAATLGAPSGTVAAIARPLGIGAKGRRGVRPKPLLEIDPTRRHTVQCKLQASEYVALRALAESEGKSASDILRALVQHALAIYGSELAA